MQASVPSHLSNEVRPTDGVDLIDEDDAWRLLFGGSEEVAYSTGADTDEHLCERHDSKVSAKDFLVPPGTRSQTR